MRKQNNFRGASKTKTINQIIEFRFESSLFLSHCLSPRFRFPLCIWSRKWKFQNEKKLSNSICTSEVLSESPEQFLRVGTTGALCPFGQLWILVILLVKLLISSDNKSFGKSRRSRSTKTPQSAVKRVLGENDSTEPKKCAECLCPSFGECNINKRNEQSIKSKQRNENVWKAQT